MDSKEITDNTIVRVSHLLKLIEDTNKQITGCQSIKDNLGVRQYTYLKRKFVKELIELLSTYQLTVRIKEAEVKEAA
jgi:hypothetical protein